MDRAEVAVQTRERTARVERVQGDEAAVEASRRNAHDVTKVEVEVEVLIVVDQAEVVIAVIVTRRIETEREDETKTETEVERETDPSLQRDQTLHQNPRDTGPSWKMLLLLKQTLPFRPVSLNQPLLLFLLLQMLLPSELLLLPQIKENTQKPQLSFNNKTQELHP